MRLHHRTPCKECPWRKDSLKGYLGGWPVETYADAVAAGEVPACHLHDHGPETDATPFCAGALACMANQALQPPEFHKGQQGAKEARDTVGKLDIVFWHHSQFYEYHAGEAWVPPMLRQAMEDTMP